MLPPVVILQESRIQCGPIFGEQANRANIRRRLMTRLMSGRLNTVRYFRCDLCSLFDFKSGLDKEARLAEKFRAKSDRKPRYAKRSPRAYKSIFDT